MAILTESLSHATDLKDLSIIQDMELSLKLSNALGKCLGLERVFLRSLVIKPEECGGFIKSLLELPKLFLVWIEGNFTTTDVINSIIWMLNSLKGSRPSVIYSLMNRAALNAPAVIYKWFVDHWPLVHLELARYKTNKS